MNLFNSSFRFLILLLTAFCASPSIAAPDLTDLNNVDAHLGKPQNRKTVSIWSVVPRPASLTPGVFKQSIDHAGQLPGQTFDQRYWIDSEYASQSETAPVIFHICGEANAETGYFLHDNAIEWAKTLGAHLVYLEHRYYGQSLPFPDGANMQYLTLNNVLEDFASFQKSISASQGWKGKWISVGGSYSGTLSAIYRQTHPELVVGALASSAPMISSVDSLSSTDFSGDGDGRSWLYQSCTTFVFWEAIGSTLYGPSASLCQRDFGNVTLADSTWYNQHYYLPFISSAAGSPSNILFTYGSEDIWTRLGLTQQDNKNVNISIKTINGAGHHYDLNYPSSSDGSEVEDARAQFVAAARTWLN